VTLKNNDVTSLKEFESTWDELLGKLDYMKSTDVYSIVKQRQKLKRQTMAIFYAMLVTTTLLGLLSIYHSIEMDFYSKEKQYMILRGLGMRKRQFAWTFMRRYIRTIFMGIIMSVFVVGGYSLLVRYAGKSLEKAYQNDTYDMLVAKKPWMEVLPKYDLFNIGMIMPEILICMICVIMIAGMISKAITKFEKNGGCQS
jgi:ABC-type lipoprotein release transport system permease subunit